jgi:hypothetical protein
MIRVYRFEALLGRTKAAIEGYQSLVAQYAHSQVAYEAQFRVGYLYESQLSDFDAAGREYDKLKLEPGYSEFQVQASRRSANLATMKQYRAALLADTTQARARSAFLLAELYYFQIEKVDSALWQYQAVEREFPTSQYAPKAAFARLWIQTHDKADTSASAALTDLIASKYRKTRYAESALYLWRRWSGRTDARTVLLDSMLANPDTTLMRERAEELLPPPPAVQDTLKSRPPSTGLTPAEEARRDSLAAYSRALYKAQREGKNPPLPPRGAPPAVADTTRAQTPPPAPSDTTRTQTPSDTTGHRILGPSR